MTVATPKAETASREKPTASTSVYRGGEQHGHDRQAAAKAAGALSSTFARTLQINLECYARRFKQRKLTLTNSNYD